MRRQNTIRSVASIAYYDNNCSRIGDRHSRIDTTTRLRRRDRIKKKKKNTHAQKKC